ncbi:MAG: hypothetical protein ACE5EM_10260 [Sphingomonadales bacterium]
MSTRDRGGLDIDGQGKKPGEDNLDFSGFKPRSQSPKSPTELSERSAEEAGFTTRHVPPPSKIDGRSLRSSNRTAQLNIAVSPQTKDRFWRLAQTAGVQTGEDFLNRLMDGFTGRQNGS